MIPWDSVRSSAP